MARNGWVTSDGDPEFRMNPELLRGPTVMRRDADTPDIDDPEPGEPATRKPVAQRPASGHITSTSGRTRSIGSDASASAASSRSVTGTTSAGSSGSHP